jgi:beta-galactosidase
MKKMNAYRFLKLVILLNLIFSYTAKSQNKEPERDRLFNNGWKFIRDSIPGAEQTGFDDSKWMTVDLPHDYSIMPLAGEDRADKVGPFSKKSPGNGNSTGHVIGGTGWYRKSFTLNKADEGKTVIINFDGVYMESEVWVNGKKAGIHKNGYTPFWFDITSLLNTEGKTNVIAVKVDNKGMNSRWYSGSGIYRNVHLVLTQPVHVAEWGVYVTTPAIKQNSAMTDIAVTTRNDGGTEANATVTVNIKDKNGSVAGTSKYNIILSGKSENITKKQVEVKNPLLWSVETPNLYSAEITIKVNDKIADTYKQTFGIRSIEVSAEKGFLLNGKSIELKGGCLHQDNGFLGSATIDRAEVRRVELMKANGFNAIRCAHNPPSETFLNACDRLGILVIDEFTDMWESHKNPQDYSRFFSEWWNKDLTDMMLRDRNHPGIIMWSIGNEIPESSTTAGVNIGKQLVDRVKALDNTRVVTEAISEIFTPGGWKNTINAIELLDVAGYNYTWTKYESDHEKYPSRIMFASESFPGDAYDSWKPAEKFPYVIGDFVWSAMDYIGEVSIGTATIVPEAKKAIFKMPAELKLPAGMNIFDIMSKMPSNWPYFISGCGDIDITGEKKPQMFYRDVLWDNSKLEINVHTPIPAGYAENLSGWGWPNELQSWTWKGCEGKPLQVRVFTKSSHVRLELNGKTVGEKDLSAGDKYIAVFDVPFEPGELKAIASDNGKETAIKVLKTAGEPFAVKLVADRNKINADRNDLSYVKIEVVDANGQLVPKDSLKINIAISGNGELVASGNTNPKDMASVNRALLDTYKGKALAVIRPTGTGGSIKLTAESQGLKAAELIIQAAK